MRKLEKSREREKGRGGYIIPFKNSVKKMRKLEKSREREKGRGTRRVYYSIWRNVCVYREQIYIYIYIYVRGVEESGFESVG